MYGICQVCLLWNDSSWMQEQFENTSSQIRLLLSKKWLKFIFQNFQLIFFIFILDTYILKCPFCSYESRKPDSFRKHLVKYEHKLDLIQAKQVEHTQIARVARRIIGPFDFDLIEKESEVRDEKGKKTKNYKKVKYVINYLRSYKAKN